MMSKPISMAAVTVMAGLLYGAADAATMTISKVTGAWTDVTAVSATQTNATGVGTDEIRWGTSSATSGTDDLSGYRFAGAAGASGIPEATNFTLGAFTHFNNPIASGTSIKKAVLEVSIDFFFDDAPLTKFTRKAVFDFLHNETPNRSNPCANGDANGSGVNVNGCADNVKPSNTSLTETFQLAGVTYIFEVTGFDIGQSFWTTERETNSASLLARFRADSLPPPPSPVPLPAGMGTLALGLGALGIAAKRRRAA